MTETKRSSLLEGGFSYDKAKMYFYYYLERQIAYHKKMKGTSSNEYYSNIIIKLESLILFVVLQ